MARPKITTQEFPQDWKEVVISMGEKGASDVEMRDYLNSICHETWTRLLKEDAEFSETIKKARVKCQAWWEKIGRENIINSYQGDNINATLWYMNMKNRFGWRDKQEIDHTSKGEQITGFTYVQPNHTSNSETT